MKDTNEKTIKRYESILDSYGHLLHRVIIRMCPKDLGIDFDDIEQEAGLRLWRALESEREITDLASYLYRIAATATIDAIRKAKSRREEQINLPGDDKENPSKQQTELKSAKSESPENKAHRRETINKVEKVLDSLLDGRKQAVGLYLNGMTSGEIGELLGWTEAKARNLLYRGLKELRIRLKAEGIEYEN